MADNESLNYLNIVSDDIVLIRDQGDKHVKGKPDIVQGYDVVFSHYCRMLSMMIITSVEEVLRMAKQRGVVEVDEYFDPNTTNGRKMEALKRIMESRGVKPDEAILRDYIAMKKMRNATLHSSSTPHDEGWWDDCGFPTDLMSFRHTHWERMKKVHDKILVQIFMLAHNM